MSDDRLLKARMDGSRARDLLNDELLKDAFAQIRRTYSEKLFSTTVDQTAAREKLYLASRVVSEVESHLQSIVGNGKLADAELNRLILAAETKPRWDQV